MVKESYDQARRFEEFLEGVEANRDLWHEVHRRARIPEDILEAARSLAGRWHLLVMAEDWCGDAIHSVPYVGLAKPDRFAGMRSWYARDRGRSVLRELMAAIPAGA
jgi:hypothetical protein